MPTSALPRCKDVKLKKLKSNFVASVGVLSFARREISGLNQFASRGLILVSLINFQKSIL